MSWRSISSALVVLSAIGGVLSGCSRQDDGYKPGDGTVSIARPESRDNEFNIKKEQVPVEPGKNPIETALNKLFATGDDTEKPSAIPKGTKLLDLKIEGGIARINVSKEWNALKGVGSNTESLAENSLRTTLAQFPDVQKMLLVVEGKPFESEHADWSEPIPVRESKAAAEGAP